MRTQFRALLCSSRHRKHEGQKTWLHENNQLTARLFLMHDLSAGRQSSRKTSVNLTRTKRAYRVLFGSSCTQNTQVRTPGHLSAIC